MPNLNVVALVAVGKPVGDEPMWCVLGQGPRRGCFWRVVYAGLSGVLQNAPITQPSPVNGFFIVPVGQLPETTAEGALATGVFPGVNLQKRGIPLPVVCTSTPTGADPVTPAGAPKFFIECTLNSPRDIIVPEGYTIAGAYTCAPGTAAPGPGLGSQCTMTVFAVEVDPSQDAVAVGLSI